MSRAINKLRHADRSNIQQFAYNVIKAMSTSTEQACITNALRWEGLEKLAIFEPFGYLLRFLVALIICNDYVMTLI